MKKKTHKISLRNFFLHVLVLFFLQSGFSQTGTFRYKREITGVEQEWHKIWLPLDLLDKTRPYLSDMRIVAVSENGKTNEVPYLIHDCMDNNNIVSYDLNIVNKSKKNARMYYTLEMPELETVNKIELYFKQENFDWLVRLEGSQDLYFWETILHSERIVAIHNNEASYRFSTLHFDDCKYKYYRISILSFRRPHLQKASIYRIKSDENEIILASQISYVYNQNKQIKQSEIKISLPHKQKVAMIKIYSHRPMDYVRSVNVMAINDSIKTAQGNQYITNLLYTGYLSSLENGTIQLSEQVAQNLLIKIDNQDNAPLEIDSVQVLIYRQHITARFIHEGKYFMLYGNAEMPKPQYDIIHFEHKIPQNLTEAFLQDEMENSAQNQIELNSDKSVYWLWALITFIVIVLGWFSFRMMKK